MIAMNSDMNRVGRAFQGLVEAAARHFTGADAAGHVRNTAFLATFEKRVAQRFGVADRYGHGMAFFLGIVGTFGHVAVNYHGHLHCHHKATSFCAVSPCLLIYFFPSLRNALFGKHCLLNSESNRLILLLS